MLIFWNLAGVPFSYCHCTLYFANHLDTSSDWSIPAMRTPALIILFTSYLFVYWIWDTTGSQKNRFRAQERGKFVPRKTFPQLPLQTLQNPRIITTKNGDTILVDGWYGYARKIHYTCDVYFALSWGVVTGFDSPFPWFYPVFFTVMILHRARRDIQRCRAKYGESWTEYEKLVPYLFVPVCFTLLPIAQNQGTDMRNEYVI
jgi:Delta24(24(1))-sterol reductase